MSDINNPLNNPLNNPSRLKVLLMQYMRFKKDKVYHTYGTLLDNFYRLLMLKNPEYEFTQYDFMQLLIFSSKVAMCDEIMDDLMDILKNSCD